MSKTAKSVKAICRKNDKFLCVESPDSNALFFPSIAVSSFRKPDIEQALEKLLEITNNDELAISRQLAKGQSTNPRYYLCYCDYEINFLANGQCAVWLTQQEMAYHKWIPEDQKMADLVMSPLFEKSPYTTKTAVQLRANDAVGRTLEEIDFNNTEKQGNKSYPGNVIEHVWFDHPADNISAPDFPEAEVELKASPIDIKKSKDGPSCIAGERLVLNTINYAKESTADFKTSSFWKKNRFIELMQYLRRIASEKGQSEDKRKYKIEYAHLLAMDDFAEPNFPQNSLLPLSEATMLRIEQDWNTIHQFIVENRADELTEGMTDTLAACTKGANNKQKSRQSNGARAKSRAYCFKQSFMTSLLQNYASDVHETTSLIKDIKQLQNRSCDSIILDYFNPFKGKSFTEIAEQFHFTIPKNISPKQTNFMLVDHMLGSNTSISKDPNDDYVSFDAEELKGIRVKTLPLFHGKPSEQFKIQSIPDFNDLINQKWDTDNCALHHLLETTKFLVFVFDNQNPNEKDKNPENIYFKGAAFWYMPASDIDIAEQVWKEDVEKLRNGVTLHYKGNRVYNNFVKASAHRVIHMRPDAHKSQYSKPAPNAQNSRKLPAKAHWINRPANHERYSEEYMTKQAWWINGAYLYSQIKDRL